MQRKNAIRAIKERLNIVDTVRRYVELKRNGPRWMAPCPFHQETKPSFSVNEEEQMFYCFGCQASGDIFDFHSRINGLDFNETLEQLALEAGITLDAGTNDGQSVQKVKKERSARQQLLRMYETAANYFAANLSGAHGEECRTYIERRGLSEEIVSRFGIGWTLRDWQGLSSVLQHQGHDLRLATEGGLLGKSEKSTRPYDRFRGRLIFPIHSLSNQVIAFGGRIIGDEDEAKYINSSDTPIYKKGDHLYGLAQSRRGISAKGNALLTEGYMDVLTLHQFGYTNAVGVLGTALTPEQIKRLSGFTSSLVLLFDGDRAGRKAALRSCEMLLTRGLSCKVVLMPDGEDIDSLLRTQGKEAFETLLAQAPEGLRFCVTVLQELAPRESVEWARNFLKNIEIEELVSPSISRLATWLRLSEPELRQNVLELRQKARQKNAAKNTGAPVTIPVREKEILRYAVRYPERLEDLRHHGADIALTTSVARRLWDKLEQTDAEEVYHHLDEREKNFWRMCRGAEAPPRTSAEHELQELTKSLDSFYLSAQKSSISAVLRANELVRDFAKDLDYLRTLQETLEKRDEQS